MSRRHPSTALLVLSLGLAACTEQPTSPSAELKPALAAAAAIDNPEGSYLVRASGQFPADFAARVEALGGKVTFTHGPSGIGAVSGLSASAASRLAAVPGIAGVEADDFTLVAQPEEYVFTAGGLDLASQAQPGLAFLFPRQWNMRQIEAPAAWAAGRLGLPTTKVGILDTGLGYTHPDLVGRVDFALSKSFVPEDDVRVQANFPGAHPVADLHVHGTHVGATITSNAVTAAGVTSRMTLVGIKVCNVVGGCPTSAVLQGVLYAADINLPVINISLVGGFQRRDASASRGGSGRSFIAIINSVFNYAHSMGTTVVVAAGNDRRDLDHDGNGYVSYCSTPHVICVAGTGPTARETVDGPWTAPDTPAPYTNFGRSSINVAAPGGNGSSSIFAACSRFSLAAPPCRTDILGIGMSGTSMAAPHVAALAALISEDVGHDPDAIRARLQQSADDLGQRGTDPYFGKGRINVRKALGL